MPDGAYLFSIEWNRKTNATSNSVQKYGITIDFGN
jgi:hypothetical protein